jgi:protein subunit release factor B
MIYPVNPKKEQELLSKMAKFNILEKDIEEKFIHSGGKGGQNVNKTSTCVYLKHMPSGLEVKCQKERSQPLNRFLARRILVDKISSMILGKRSEKEQEIEKIRRQKRKRSKRAKNKMLEQKKAQSQKKQFRKPVSDYNI